MMPGFMPPNNPCCQQFGICLSGPAGVVEEGGAIRDFVEPDGSLDIRERLRELGTCFAGELELEPAPAGGSSANRLRFIPRAGGC